MKIFFVQNKIVRSILSRYSRGNSRAELVFLGGRGTGGPSGVASCVVQDGRCPDMTLVRLHTTACGSAV